MVFQYVILFNSDRELATTIHEASFLTLKSKFQSNKRLIFQQLPYYSPWQNGISERANGIIRQELTNHIIPLSQKHVTSLLDDYINNYYNTHRTHQGINCKTPIPLPKYKPGKLENSKLKETPILNGLYHTYDKVA